jgi:thioredoxin reductase (NADPH)
VQEIIGEKEEILKEIVKHEKYDVVIIGGGPAGLTAGIYCARARLRTVLLEGAGLGGQVAMTEKIENYPGFLGDSGAELISNMEKQAREFGLEIQTFKMVTEVRTDGLLKEVYAGNDLYPCHAVILATGLKTAELNLPRESHFRGGGVSYCAICDANFFNGKSVAVVGGGDTAVEDAIYLSKFASQVFVIHRRDELRAAKILQETAFCTERITFLWSHIVQDLIGTNVLDGLILQDLKTGNEIKLDVDGLFVAIGSRPYTGFLENLVALDDQGFVKVNDRMETSVPGVFAAGDIRVTPLRQVSTAVGDGAIAAISSERFLSEIKAKEVCQVLSGWMEQGQASRGGQA